MTLRCPFTTHLFLLFALPSHYITLNRSTRFCADKNRP
nr:MAG TPA_asm: hypothetical protein [Caudoviricetes sp.]